MRSDFDLIIVGSGFAGALLAMVARQLGKRVVLVERGSHPRFAIGESSTPLANLLLEELAVRYALPKVGSLAKWGTWQRDHPLLPVGLKRGFTFYHHEWGRPLNHPPENDRMLMVAASPNDALADTHWYRPAFDQYLVQEAVTLGVEYLDQTDLEKVEENGDGIRVQGLRNGRTVSLQAPWMVDASGPRGFLARRLRLESVRVPGLEDNQGLFAHFTGVHPMADTWGTVPDAPYPADLAATHHCFPGGWIWVLPFNHGITSAGVSTCGSLSEELGLSSGGEAWTRLLTQLPTVREQFADARVVDSFHHAPALSYQCTTASGNRWAMLPSAVGFSDPLLSSGFALTLRGIQRLAQAMERQSPPSLAALNEYGEAVQKDQEAANLLVAALHRNLGKPSLFNQLLMVYFASVSYAETAMRFNHSELCPGFLLNGRAGHWPKVANLLRERLDGTIESAGFDLRVREAIAEVNLCDWMSEPHRRCYGVDRDAMIHSWKRFGASATEISELGARLGVL